MDELERDYPSVLLAERTPPCLSLYQPTHRGYPDRRQDPIRFRNLVKGLETSLRQKYAARDVQPLLAPFHALADDLEFWRHTQDGLAVLAAPDFFKVYRLQRPVPELCVVADSLHTKPLLRVMQSADRYHILGISRQEMRLFEGNRYAVDELEPAPEVPRTATDAVGEKAGEPERRNRVYGSAVAGAVAAHGTDVREQELASEVERFFRAVDRAVLEQHSRPSGLPLLLAALPENDHLFRSVSRNPFLMAETIDADPDALSLDELRERAWELVLPHYLARLGALVDRFHAAKAKELGAADLAEIARAAVAGRVEALLIEAERQVPGRFDPATGRIDFEAPGQPGVDDLLDDLGEHTLRSGGEVVIVPAERMPTDSGIAAIYRF